VATRIVAAIIAGMLVFVFEIFVPATAAMHVVIAFLVFEAWLLSELFIEVAIREPTTSQAIQDLRTLLREKIPNLEALRVLASREEADLYLTEALAEEPFVRNPGFQPVRAWMISLGSELMMLFEMRFRNPSMTRTASCAS